MATRQSLRGGTDKIYEIVNNFSVGYNTSVADDLLKENYFRDVNNFLPSEEGNVTKRPGINKIGLYDLFNELTNNLAAYNDIIFSFKGTDNVDISLIFNRLFKMQPYKYVGDDYTFEYTPSSLANFTVVDDTGGLLNKTTNLANLLKDNSLYSSSFKTNLELGVTDTNVLSLIMIFINSSKKSAGSDEFISYETISIYNMNIKYYRDITNDKKHIDIIVDYKFPTVEEVYDNDDIINLAVYNDNYYFMNGVDSIIKIPKIPNEATAIEDKYKIDVINKTNSNIYKPTAIEVKNIGFNILAENPVTYIDNTQGATNTIRGVFFMHNGEPTQVIPYNKSFEVHIISSGSNENQTPKYRPNNGEIDESKNPYKDLPGSYNSDKSVFTCSGLNETSSIELKIAKGTGTSAANFYTYFTMGTVADTTIGKIDEVSNLILSSRYCKVINNQLVLYGNHGYMFFSDYDNFKYFPNYYFTYLAESEGEEVVNISYFRQYYVVFTNKRIKRMSGSFGSDDFGIYPLNDAIGCSNTNSVKQVSNYLYFLSYNGLYRLKQGYLGEGTENVDQIDLPIYKSYITDNILKACTFMNYYALFSDEEAIYYNYINDAYYKFKTANTVGVVDSYGKVKDAFEYTVPFQYSKFQNLLFYGVKETIDTVNSNFDICVQNFSSGDLVVNDNGVSIVSSFETCFMSLGSPTNIKKFKAIYLKFYNKCGKNIPLYATIKVDDKIVVSPEMYTVDYDEATDTYYYNEKTESNKTLKGYKVLGEMTLGEDIMGERTMQVLKMKVGEKGRAIKVEISDGIKEGEEGYKAVQNDYKFDLSTIGIVYKLKKVKEV